MSETINKHYKPIYQDSLMQVFYNLDFGKVKFLFCDGVTVENNGYISFEKYPPTYRDIQRKTQNVLISGVSIAQYKRNLKISLLKNKNVQDVEIKNIVVSMPQINDSIYVIEKETVTIKEIEKLLETYNVIYVKRNKPNTQFLEIDSLSGVRIKAIDLSLLRMSTKDKDDYKLRMNGLKIVLSTNDDIIILKGVSAIKDNVFVSFLLKAIEINKRGNKNVITNLKNQRGLEGYCRTSDVQAQILELCKNHAVSINGMTNISIINIILSAGVLSGAFNFNQAVGLCAKGKETTFKEYYSSNIVSSDEVLNDIITQLQEANK